MDEFRVGVSTDELIKLKQDLEKVQARSMDELARLDEIMRLVESIDERMDKWIDAIGEWTEQILLHNQSMPTKEAPIVTQQSTYQWSNVAQQWVEIIEFCPKGIDKK